VPCLQIALQPVIFEVRHNGARSRQRSALLSVTLRRSDGKVFVFLALASSFESRRVLLRALLCSPASLTAATG